MRIAVQKDHYVTEVSVALPADVKEVDEMLRRTGTNGKMVVQYNQGRIQGINVEQRTKINPDQSVQIRPLLKIESLTS